MEALCDGFKLGPLTTMHEDAARSNYGKVTVPCDGKSFNNADAGNQWETSNYHNYIKLVNLSEVLNSPRAHA